MAMPNLPLGQSSVPSSRVELSVACRKLQNRDVTSKSDPLCILYMCEFGSTKFNEIGRTECIKDTLNPDFVKKFVIEYRFEEQQKLRFIVIDADSTSQDVKDHDYLGQFEASVGELVSAGSSTKPLRPFSGHSNCGNIIIRSEEVIACNELLIMKLSGSKLDKKDTFGKSDPFLVFYKSNEDQSFTAVHKSEVIKNTLNPAWREMMIPVGTLCNGDKARTLKVECYDWDSDGSHDLIGCFLTNVDELAKTAASFELKNPKKTHKKKYVNSGVIHVEHTRMEKSYSFLDYIQAGVQINFTVAIDFTGSNGKPSDPRSLHYLGAPVNQYVTALSSVGSIISDYDSDKMFPALGFGAKLPNGTVSHEFFLNMQTNPFCAGIGGVIQAYQQAIRTVELWGPTNFAPVINHVAQFARAMRDGTNYFVLLICTDGVITDFPHTVDAIIEASALPMSIIIVGVGDADFSEMELLDDALGGSKTMDALDSDGHALTSKGKTALRDIVQFVPLSDFLSGRGDPNMIQARLAKEVLAEVPEQFLSYMKKHKIQPPQQRLAPQSISGQAGSAPPMPQPT